ncbi:MAG TPA: hypothetical protein VJV78_43900 [Polyangiales bacterium]|nr:hypothetical protein [Polyangiales bacterium]
MQQVAELLSAFIAYEERAHLFERSAMGVRYWQYIRHDVFQETLQALGLAERAHLRVEELPISSWLPEQLRTLPGTLQRSLWPRLPRAELLVANHPRHVMHEGRSICPYTQPLLDAGSHTRVVLEGQFQGRYAPALPGQPTVYMDLSLIAGHLQLRAADVAGSGISALELAELEEIRGGLTQALGAAPPSAALARRQRTAVAAWRGLSDRYAWLLDRVQPRLVLVVIGYRLLHQVLTVVAHSRGLRVAELQHGALGASHPAYNFAPGRRPESFPDQLLLFGSLWRAATPGLPLPPEATPAIGYAWLELQKQRFARQSPTEPRRVLFISQRSIGNTLAKLAVRVRELCPKHELHISYRLHPSEHTGWREAYPELARADIDVEAADSRPLYAAQRDSDAQVGVYSTALLEGLAFGLPTYVVPLPGHEQLGSILAAGLAHRIPDAISLVSALRKPLLAANANQDSLWAPGATTAFERILAEIR